MRTLPEVALRAITPFQQSAKGTNWFAQKIIFQKSFK
jgi:hypothetical protein